MRGRYLPTSSHVAKCTYPFTGTTSTRRWLMAKFRFFLFLARLECVIRKNGDVVSTWQFSYSIYQRYEIITAANCNSCSWCWIMQRLLYLIDGTDFHSDFVAHNPQLFTGLQASLQNKNFSGQQCVSHIFSAILVFIAVEEKKDTFLMKKDSVGARVFKGKISRRPGSVTSVWNNERKIAAMLRQFALS